MWTRRPSLLNPVNFTFIISSVDFYVLLEPWSIVRICARTTVLAVRLLLYVWVCCKLGHSPCCGNAVGQRSKLWQTVHITSLWRFCNTEAECRNIKQTPPQAGNPLQNMHKRLLQVSLGVVHKEQNKNKVFVSECAYSATIHYIKKDFQSQKNLYWLV